MRNDVQVSDKCYQNSGNGPLLRLIGQHFAGRVGRVLDIGCGAGDNARELAAKNWRVAGVTLSESEAEIARPYCENVYIQNLEEGLPQAVKNGSFDLALMSHVLEHLRDPLPLLKELRKCLAPHAAIAVALPNVAHYGQRLRLLRGQWQYTSHGIMDNTHFKFYTFETGQKLLTDAGYKIAESEAVGAAPWWFTRKIVPTRIRARIDNVACRIKPNLFGLEMQFIATSNDAVGVEAAGRNEVHED